MRKGFTLIELLIVIAIIGILATALLVSLGGARQAARDARRIADLRQVQAALELYFNSTGNYPNANSWSSLTAIITAANIGVTRIPNDPISANSYAYDVDGTFQTYVLAATLEGASQALNSDFDGSLVNGINAIDCTFSASGLTVEDVYCVGN